jgi:chemotaxis protein MotA
LGGLIFGLAAIFYSIYASGDINGFIDRDSIIIVFGGILAATVVSYPLSVLKNLGKIIGLTFKSKKIDLSVEVDNIIDLANVARREGILALEERVKDMNDPFLKKGIMLIVDGSDPELVRSIMETELDFINDRHAQGQAVLLTMSSYAPAYGMIGTLIGLINMLAELDDPDNLASGMAVALVTTFYGSFLANLLFTPLAKKLGVI